MDSLTLDQFQVFVAVVEAGSFSAAARRLNRAQSAVTYVVQKLEQQVGAELFDRAAYRPSLSEAGRILLPQARRILDDLGRFRSSAREITRGLEAELSIGIAGGVPLTFFIPILTDFRDAFPTVQLRLVMQPFSMMVDRNAPAVAKGATDLRILYDIMLPDILERYAIAEIGLMAVAAPSHPLARMSGPLDDNVLRDHLQIVLSEMNEAVVGNDRRVVAFNTWRVTDQFAQYSLLAAGIGWGSLPDVLVEEDLASGRLVRLDVEADRRLRQVRRLSLVVAHRHDEPPGPAGRWFVAKLRERTVTGDGRPAL